MNSHNANAAVVVQQSTVKKRILNGISADLQKSENQSIYQNDDRSLRYKFHSKISATPSTRSWTKRSPTVAQELTLNALNFRSSAAIDHSFSTNGDRDNINNSIDRIPITNGTPPETPKSDGSTFFGDIIPFGFPINLWQTIALLLTIALPTPFIGTNGIYLTKSQKGWRHSCVVWYNNGSCWGWGNKGRLGQGSTTNYWYPPPDPISLNADFVPIQIAMGFEHSCSLSVDGRVACWGDNSVGQLGLGNTTIIGDGPSEMGDSLQTANLGTDFVVIQLVAGFEHSCALSTNFELKCWGRNLYGELGQGNNVRLGVDSGEMGDDLIAIQLGDGFIPNKVVAGGWFNCVLSTGNAIKCFGDNQLYQLGDGTNENRGDDVNEMGNNLNAVDLGTDFVPIDIEAGAHHVCAVTESKTVKCWGSNEYGQLGIGCGWTEQFGDSLPTLHFAADFAPKMMGMGYFHSCFVSTNGSMVCFGDNGQGQLGYGDTSNRGGCGDDNISDLVPIDFGTGFDIAQIQIMSYHGCVLNAEDELKCWGSNSYGQLGYNDNDNRGDDADEMGDNLAVVPIWFPGNPTANPTTSAPTNPTISPTVDPTTKPTFDPTTDPTNDPTTDPSLSPTDVPSVSPTGYPTERGIQPPPFGSTDPTVEPTKVPSVEPTANPTETTSAPTTHPTSPTAGTSLEPTDSPTIEPTVEPSTEPTLPPTSDPTTKPTNDPMTEPTLSPTTICDPLRNCTQCLSANPDNRTWCLWHSTHNGCYFVSDLVYIDQNVIVDEASCITIEAAASTNMVLFQWIGVSVVIAMICLLAMIVLYILKKRRKLQFSSQKMNIMEMRVNPEHSEYVEREDSSSAGSRSEGIEIKEGGDAILATNTVQHADV